MMSAAIGIIGGSGVSGFDGQKMLRSVELKHLLVSPQMCW